MKLIEFSTEERREFADKMGVTTNMVYQWAKGYANMSKNKAIEIEQKTDGLISRLEAMFPEIDFS